MISNNGTQLPVKTPRIRQIFLISADPPATARFYAQALGLDEQFREGARWVQFTAGTISFSIADPSEAALPPGTVVPVFEVDDLETATAAALAAGACHNEHRDMGPHGSLALLTDTAGAPLALLARGGGRSFPGPDTKR